MMSPSFPNPALPPQPPPATVMILFTKSLHSNHLGALAGTPAHTNAFKLFYKILEHPEWQSELGI